VLRNTTLKENYFTRQRSHLRQLRFRRSKTIVSYLGFLTTAAHQNKRGQRLAVLIAAATRACSKGKMILEAVIIIATIFIIAVFFYKQTNPEYRILQVEKGEFSKLLDLLPELSPIVVRGLTMPNFWTTQDIALNPRLKTIPLVYPGFQPFPLSAAHTTVLPTRPSATAQQIALESGIQVWAEHTILPVFAPLWYSPAISLMSAALIGQQGLQQTTAFLTILMPTQDPIKVSLLHKKQYDYCPKNWQYSLPSTWTKATTPLVGEIQFIDVIVRPGTLLVLPPHWRYSYTSDAEKPMVALLELQHPLSQLAGRSFKN